MKTKIDYLLELEGELKFLKKKDRNDFIRYYRQKIDAELDYGIAEEKVINKLPTPRSVALKIYDDKGINYLKMQKHRMTTSTIIFSILSILLIIGTIYLGGNIIWSLLRTLVNMITLYSPFFQLPAVDLILSTLFLTIYILLVTIFIVILMELVLLIIRTLVHKLIDIYPINKEINLEPYSLFYWVNKLFKNESVIFKAFGGLAALLVIVGVVGYFNKSYIYRVLHNTPGNEKTYVMDDIDLNGLSLELTNYETGLSIYTHDEDYIKIKYKYEIDHFLSWEEVDDTLSIKVNDPKQYDVLNLLKEPIQHIYLMIPKTMNLNQLKFKITYGEVSLENMNFNGLDLQMLSGKVVLKNCVADSIKAEIRKVDYYGTQNTANNVNLKTELGKINSDDEVIINYQIENVYAVAQLLNLVSEQILINNQGGDFYFLKPSAKNLTINTSSGEMTVKDYLIDEILYSGSGIGNLSLNGGAHTMATIDMREGLVYTTRVAGDVKITGHDLNNYNTDHVSGFLDINQELGNIDIISTLDEEFKISLLKCTASDINLTITTTHIDEMDINLGRAIVVIEDVYGRIVNIKVKSGDLNYYNNDLSYEFETFNATIELGSKNGNIENTTE